MKTGFMLLQKDKEEKNACSGWSIPRSLQRPLFNSRTYQAKELKVIAQGPA
jgi:hypothetical protein